MLFALKLRQSEYGILCGFFRNLLAKEKWLRKHDSGVENRAAMLTRCSQYYLGAENEDEVFEVSLSIF